MSTTITASELHHRQLTLLGEKAHQKIRQSRLLVVGAGGLGCPALQYLAGAGVGRLGIVDFDNVSASNLQRQILFTVNDIGRNKALMAREKLQQLAPFCDFHSYPAAVGPDNVTSLIEDHDVVLDCTDNFHTKFLLHDACFQQRKILVQASVYQYEGQLQVYDFRQQEGPCWRCLWPEPPQDGCTGTCAEVGVLGPLLGVMGSLQAMEALKVITGQEHLPNGTSLLVDLQHMIFEKNRFKQLPECECCVRRKLSPKAFSAIPLPADLGPFIILDVRSPEEVADCFFVRRLTSNQRFINHPLENIAEFKPKAGEKYLTICARGSRSLKAAQVINTNEIEVYSLLGGVNGIT